MNTLKALRFAKQKPKTLDEYKGIRLPTAFEVVDIGASEETKRRVIKDHDRQLALLRDRHYVKSQHYLTGRIFYDSQDQECYKFQRVEDGEAKGQVLQLHFNDLEDLIVPIIH